MATSATVPRLISAIAGLFMALTLVGCSGGISDNTSASSDSGGGSSGDIGPAGAPQEDQAQSESLAVDPATGSAESGSTGVSTDLIGQSRAVIATGTVSLNAKDVSAARSEVTKVTDSYRGEVAEEQTESDGKGSLVAVRVVIRVPSTNFSAAMDDLEAISKYHSRTIGTEDVTTQVIDVDARVQAQTKSLARIEALLAEATTLRDVIAIESQLTSRQAELESLKAQQAWLKDQTTMSTITVDIHEVADEDPPKDDDNGFIAGIKSGWHALGSATVGVMTILGAVLPFAIVAGIVGYPLWLLGRRLGRPATQAPTSDSAAQDLTE